MAPAAWRAGASRRPRPTNLDAEVLIGQGQMFAGNPDTVARQIKDFRKRVGGIGHIIMMTRQGLVTHAEAEKSFTARRQGACCRNCRTCRRSMPDETAWLARQARRNEQASPEPHPDLPASGGGDRWAQRGSSPSPAGGGRSGGGLQ